MVLTGGRVSLLMVYVCIDRPVTATCPKIVCRSRDGSLHFDP